jgi:hypothetical protein
VVLPDPALLYSHFRVLTIVYKEVFSKMMQMRNAILPSHFQGIARTVDFRTNLGNRTRTDQGFFGSAHGYVNNIQVLTFRLELTDKYGNIIALKAVELRGEKIFGVISDGDTVEVIGRETRTGISQPQKIYNLTTGAEIVSKYASENSGCLHLIGFLFVAISVAFISYPIFSAMFGPSIGTFAVCGLLGYLFFSIVNHK